MDNLSHCADNTGGHGCAGVLRAHLFCDPGQDEIQMIKVGVVGGTGYTGVDLLRLLALHPQVQRHALVVVCPNPRDPMCCVELGLRVISALDVL